MPAAYSANSTRPCRLNKPRHSRCGMKAPISSAYTGRRAEQVINGATRIVARRSRGSWIERVAMMPGHRAGEARQQRNERASRQAGAEPSSGRAGTPRAAGSRDSSSARMKANRIRICGRNTITPPTPAMMPSTSRLLSGPSGRVAADAAAQRGRAGLDQVHQRRRPGIHRLEDQEHHHGQRQQAQHRMQQPAVERVVDLGGAARHRHRQRQQAARFGVQRVGVVRRASAAGARWARAGRSATHRASPPARARRRCAPRRSAPPACRVRAPARPGRRRCRDAWPRPSC